MPAPLSVQNGVEIFNKNFDALVLEPYAWNTHQPDVDDFSLSAKDILGALMAVKFTQAPGAKTLLNGIFTSLAGRPKEDYAAFARLGRDATQDLKQVEVLIEALDDENHGKDLRRKLFRCFDPSPSAADAVEKCAEFYQTKKKQEVYVAVFVLMAQNSMKFAEESLSLRSSSGDSSKFKRNATFRCCVGCLAQGPIIRGTAKLLARYIKYVEGYREKAMEKGTKSKRRTGGGDVDEGEEAAGGDVKRPRVSLTASSLAAESFRELESLRTKLELNRKTVTHLCENVHGASGQLQLLLESVTEVCRVATTKLDSALDSRASSCKNELVALRATLVDTSEALRKLFDPRDRLSGLRRDWEDLHQLHPGIVIPAPPHEGAPTDVVNFLRVALPGVLAVTKDLMRKSEIADQREIRLDEAEREVERSTEAEKRAYSFLRSGDNCLFAELCRFSPIMRKNHSDVFPRSWETIEEDFKDGKDVTADVLFLIASAARAQLAGATERHEAKERFLDRLHDIIQDKVGKKILTLEEGNDLLRVSEAELSEESTCGRQMDVWEDMVDLLKKISQGCAATRNPTASSTREHQKEEEPTSSSSVQKKPADDYDSGSESYEYSEDEVDFSPEKDV